MSFTLRPATPDDADLLVRLILELAEYEKMSDEAQPDPAALRQHLAPDARPRCEALIAEVEGKGVGFALYFPSYSTFLTRWGTYLEDLYVQPDYRGRGIGFALLRRLAALTVEGGGERLDWSVLTWNRLAIDFYEQIGARPQTDWQTMRLDGEALSALAAQDETS